MRIGEWRTRNHYYLHRISTHTNARLVHPIYLNWNAYGVLAHRRTPKRFLRHKLTVVKPEINSHRTQTAINCLNGIDKICAGRWRSDCKLHKVIERLNILRQTRQLLDVRLGFYETCPTNITNLNKKKRKNVPTKLVLHTNRTCKLLEHSHVSKNKSFECAVRLFLNAVAADFVFFLSSYISRPFVSFVWNKIKTLHTIEISRILVNWSVGSNGIYIKLTRLFSV